MKAAKKILAMVMALMLVLSLATTAFAAEGDIYEIYQIFTGDYSEGILSNVKWGKNGTGDEGKAVDATILKALADVNNGTDAEKLAVIEQYFDNDSDPIATSSETTYNDLKNGYYLIKNIDGSQEGEGQFYTLYVVKVVNGTLTFSPKGSAPKVEKTVNDNDANIGDTVTFTLTATMPSDLNGYESYKVTFHDTMSEGLTFDASSVKVSVDGTEITTGFELKYPATDSHSFDVIIANIFAVGAKEKSIIKVEYNATLNANAVIGLEGNPNEVYLEYSNNPNTGAEGETGNTPKDEVEVYTWDMEVLKYANNVKSVTLKGVKFILLTKDESKIAKVTDRKIVSWDPFNDETVIANYELTTDDNGKIHIDGIEKGEYLLRETQELPGYNKLDGDVAIEIVGATEVEGADGKTELTYNIVLAEVNNNSGAILPETGGMGTTLFYVLGGILVLAAVVLLVTKKRMAA